jgi:hypothetical protein
MEYLQWGKNAGQAGGMHTWRRFGTWVPGQTLVSLTFLGSFPSTLCMQQREAGVLALLPFHSHAYTCGRIPCIYLLRIGSSLRCLVTFRARQGHLM